MHGRMLLALQDLIDTLKDKNTNSLIKHELSYGQNAAVLKKIFRSQLNFIMQGIQLILPWMKPVLQLRLTNQLSSLYRKRNSTML
jgi:phage-related protein